MQYNNRHNRKYYRSKLRGKSTLAEKRLWLFLRNRQLEGVKFRRQHSYGPYIMDFYCSELRLCIELDGAGHFNIEGMERDQIRAKYLQDAHIELLRIENKDVLIHIDGVLETIRTYVKELKMKWREAS